MAPSASTSAAKTQILQHAGTGPTARTPTKITDPATHSSQQFRPRAAKSRTTSPEIPIDRHCRWRILPRGFLLRGFSDACLRAAPRAVTGRHPKTLNELPRSGGGWEGPESTLPSRCCAFRRRSVHLGGSPWRTSILARCKTGTLLRSRLTPRQAAWPWVSLGATHPTR